ncbi:hypothetical protein [Pseudomonas sp. LP_7_YM]|uniref:hypothetical protein n=1 Tax=Pseudomonas sp. LP_7_YM TaxID=2485137 RepID=UPI00105CF733|nr:hypothetical protein [Pseudomonas sp. LP_7_YM]TDV61779.1 hypothetical protein EC915_1082 [Pseudomonas sp. LP_7_YM]
MNINGSLSTQALVAALPTKAPASGTSDTVAASTEVADGVGKKDTVSLSYSAIAAAQQDDDDLAAKVSSKSSGFVPGLPDEAYAVPNWMAGYYNDITYMLTMGLPYNYVPPENVAYMEGSPQDQAAYAALLQSHIRELYDNSGLGNTAECYYALKNDPSLNEKLHQAFTESVSSDPEMMEVMSRLGISLS